MGEKTAGKIFCKKFFSRKSTVARSLLKLHLTRRIVEPSQKKSAARKSAGGKWKSPIKLKDS